MLKWFHRYGRASNEKPGLTAYS